MRVLTIAALFLLLLPSAAIAVTGKHAGCSALEPDQDISFDGHTLREIADIEDAELRRANRLLSARCFEDAERAIDAYQAAHPDDYKLAYVSARRSWMTGQAADATTLLNDTIAKYPDFASAYVLLAGMAIAAEDYNEASRLLAIADPLSPTDLWLFLDHLRIAAAAASPDAAVIDQIVRIMDDPNFRRAIRLDMAVRVIGPLSAHVDSNVLERAYRLNLEIGDQPYPNRVEPYATWLIESEHRTEEARHLLEPLLSKPMDHPEVIRELIAESWLFDAAEIDPVQTPRNFALIEKARNQLGGNIDVIARASALNPALKPLHGFFAIVEEVDKPDESGDTSLCLAVRSLTLDVSMITDLLDNLADPNQVCRGTGTTPVGLVLTQGVGDTAQRTALLKEMLAHGGDPNPIWFQQYAKDFCNNTEPCLPLLPVLEPAWAAADATSP